MPLRAVELSVASQNCWLLIGGTLNPKPYLQVCSVQERPVRSSVLALLRTVLNPMVETPKGIQSSKRLQKWVLLKREVPAENRGRGGHAADGGNLEQP